MKSQPAAEGEGDRRQGSGRGSDGRAQALALRARRVVREWSRVVARGDVRELGGLGPGRGTRVVARDVLELRRLGPGRGTRLVATRRAPAAKRDELEPGGRDVRHVFGVKREHLKERDALPRPEGRWLAIGWVNGRSVNAQSVKVRNDSVEITLKRRSAEPTSEVPLHEWYGGLDRVGGALQERWRPASHEGGEGRAEEGERHRTDAVVDLGSGTQKILHGRRLRRTAGKGWRCGAVDLMIEAVLAAEEWMPRAALHRAPTRIIPGGSCRRR